MGANRGTAVIRTTENDVANLLLGMALFATMLLLFLNIPLDEVVARVSNCMVMGRPLPAMVNGDIASDVVGVFGVLEVSTLAYALVVIVKSALCLVNPVEDKTFKVIDCFQNILFWTSGIVASCILMFAVFCFLSSASQYIPVLATTDVSAAEFVDSTCPFCALVAMAISFVADIVITAMGLSNAGDYQITKAVGSLNRYQPLLWVTFIISPAIISLVFAFICAILIAIVVAILSAIIMVLMFGVMAATVFVIFIRELLGF